MARRPTRTCADNDPSTRALRNHRLRLRAGRGGSVPRAGAALRGRAHDHERRACRRPTVVSVPGNRCISVGHKSEISGADAARAAGRRRGARLDPQHRLRPHRPAMPPHDLGITVENVVYAPDGVADFTLMLILMAIRNAEARRQLGGPARLPAGQRPRQGPARPDRRRRGGREHRPRGDQAAARIRMPGAGVQQRPDRGGGGGARLPRRAAARERRRHAAPAAQRRHAPPHRARAARNDEAGRVPRQHRARARWSTPTR